MLEANTLSAFCQYIRENNCQNLIVLTGAGISTSAGIPDFRSPETGLYANLSKYELPYPEAIFDIDYFKWKPEAFFTLAAELLPGMYQPTPCHEFIRLLQEKNLLLRNYTQNIDMLERLAGVKDELLVEAHGSFHLATCVGARVDDEDDVSYGCGKSFRLEAIREALIVAQIPECECGGIVKPNIVFFGENLPTRFYQLLEEDFAKCDALIVMGTSLQVGPFNTLIDLVRSDVPRLLINREEAGVYDHKHMGFDFIGKYQKHKRDALYLGDCDEGALAFQREMGWLKRASESKNEETEVISVKSDDKEDVIVSPTQDALDASDNLDTIVVELSKVEIK